MLKFSLSKEGSPDLVASLVEDWHTDFCCHQHFPACQGNRMLLNKHIARHAKWDSEYLGYIALRISNP